MGNACSNGSAAAENCGGDMVTERRTQTSDELITQGAQTGNLIGSALSGDGNRSGKGGSTSHIRSAGAPAAFLATAEKERVEGDTRPNEQGAGTHRPTQFVAGDRHQVEVGGCFGNVDPTTGLHRVGVEECVGLGLAYGRSKGRQVVDGAGLVVDGNHRHDRDIVELDQRLGKRLGIDPTVAAKGNHNASGILDRLEDRMVFARRANRDSASGTEHAADRQIVGFAATAGEDDFSGGTPIRFSDQVPGIVERSAGRACGTVRAGRVGVMRLRGRDPGFARLWSNRGACCMIEVDLAVGHGPRLRGATPVTIHRQTGAMKGYSASSYGDGFADIYDDWYSDVSDIDATVDAVTSLADGGAVLELGIGTGRLALPLAERGVAVTGVDASRAMLDALRAKPGAEVLELVEADMADPGLTGRSFAVAFAAFNTFFNLTDAAAQASCFAAMHACLQPNGRFAIEGFVPPVDGMSDGGMSVRDITVDRAVLTISQHDSASQVISGQHVDISEAGIRMRPWMMHYRTPDQLDAAAGSAGFVLESRSADWAGTSFDSQSDTHVSIYRRRCRAN